MRQPFPIKPAALVARARCCPCLCAKWHGSRHDLALCAASTGWTAAAVLCPVAKNAAHLNPLSTLGPPLRRGSGGDGRAHSAIQVLEPILRVGERCRRTGSRAEINSMVRPMLDKRTATRPLAPYWRTKLRLLSHDSELYEPVLDLAPQPCSPMADPPSAVGAATRARRKESRHFAVSEENEGGCLPAAAGAVHSAR